MIRQLRATEDNKAIEGRRGQLRVEYDGDWRHMKIRGKNRARIFSYAI